MHKLLKQIIARPENSSSLSIPTYWIAVLVSLRSRGLFRSSQRLWWCFTGSRNDKYILQLLEIYSCVKISYLQKTTVIILNIGYRAYQQSLWINTAKA